MAKNLVTDWDVAAANNSDIAGVNIAEGCPAGGINDAIRTLMAQIAAWIISAAGPLLKSGGAVTGAITGMLTGSTVIDGAGTARFVGYRNIPFTAATTGRTIALTDVGMGIPTTGAITVPPNSTTAFLVGDTIAIYNNSAATIAITQGAGVTLRLTGSATTGSRTIGQRGLGSLVKVGADEWIISGMGVA